MSIPSKVKGFSVLEILCASLIGMIATIAMLRLFTLSYGNAFDSFSFVKNSNAMRNFLVAFKHEINCATDLEILADGALEVKSINTSTLSTYNVERKNKKSYLTLNEKELFEVKDCTFSVSGNLVLIKLTPMYGDRMVLYNYKRQEGE